jgi:hypothetical protein
MHRIIEPFGRSACKKINLDQFRGGSIIFLYRCNTAITSTIVSACNIQSALSNPTAIALQLTDGPNAQTDTVKPNVHYPGANEYQTWADVIRYHSCQHKAHGPESVSSPLMIDVDVHDTMTVQAVFATQLRNTVYQ